MTTQDDISADHLDSLISILQLIRSGSATTRPEIERATGYGRALVAQRVSSLTALGLVRDGEARIEGRGRAARTLQFAADCGVLLLAEIGASITDACVSDLNGTRLAAWSAPRDIHQGPESVLEDLSRVFDDLLTQVARDRRDVWGIGIGVPAPVEHDTGTTSASAIMPKWEGFSARDFLSGRFGAPTWIDNDVNLMALAEFLPSDSADTVEAIYVKIGSGIGSGVISGGRLHRGARGAAGDLAHIEVEHNSLVHCRCGQRGCLEAIAGGVALISAAEKLADRTTSPRLAEIVSQTGALTIADLVIAANLGDPLARELFARSARAVGSVLAGIVNFQNPSQVVLGGSVAHSADAYLAIVREEIFRRSLPLATRHLEVRLSDTDNPAGLRGAAIMVQENLFSRTSLMDWLRMGNPRLEDDQSATWVQAHHVAQAG